MTEPRAPAPGSAELPQALVLNEPEIRSLVTPKLALEAVRQAFVTYARGDALLPDVLHMDLPGHRGEIHVKGGFLAGASTWCVKAASAFYDNPVRGLPIATGVSLALSAETGFLRALLLDNGYLTELRTGAAGALAADLLAPRIVRQVLIVGAGGQARYQLEALLEVRRPERVFVHSRTRAHAEQYAAEMTAAHGIPVQVADSLPEAVSASQLIVMTTPARSPILRAEWLGPGTHITAMGSDLPGKQELFVDVLERADVFVADNVEQTATQGELQHGLAARVINLDDVLSLGDIAAGIQPGRTSPTQITVADLTGVGVQDTAIADLAVTLAEATGAGRLLGAP
jgi:ornithine cyclodeaminase/alanine dehydrogenase-like protein (mu-crystallin family)